MAQVPYTGAPSIGAEPNPMPTRVLEVPAAAFGAATAQAISHLGQVAAGAGDELFGRAFAMQQVAEAASANKAVADYTIAMGEAFAKYKSLQGDKAVAGYQPFVQELSDLREKVRGSLSSEFAQKAYDNETRTMFSRTVMSSASHAGEQNKAYIIGSNIDRSRADAAYAGMNPDDEKSFETSVKTNQTAAEIEGGQVGRNEDYVKNRALELNTNLVTSRVTGALRDDPGKAQRFLEDAQKRGLVDGDTRTKLQNQIDSTIQNKTSTKVAAELFNAPKMKDATYADLEAAAEKKAEELFPGNDVFKQVLVQKTIAYKNKDESIKKADEFNRRNTLAEELAGVGMKDGKLPTDVDELTPAGKAAYLNGDGKTKAWVMKQLSANAKNDFRMTPENQQVYNYMLGVLTNPQATPKEREEVMNMDTTNLPAGQRRQINQLQVKLFNNQVEQFAVNQGMNMLKDVLASVDVIPTNKNVYNQFRGAYSQALQLAAEENKGPLTKEQIREVGVSLLSGTKVESPWYKPWQRFTSGGLDERRAFEVEASAEFKTKVIKMYRAKGESAPPDALINSMYAAERLRAMSQGFQMLFNNGKSPARAK